VPENKTIPPSNPNTGHRQRLRERFLKHGLDNFQDYEVLELLLLFVARQRDMKPVAKRLIEKFGFFQAVLDAGDEELLAVEGLGESGLTLLKLTRGAAARYLSQTSQLNLAPQNLTELVNYCRLEMGALPNEQFRSFSLNAGFVLVGDDIIADGTIDQATVYPRKVIEIALKRGAVTLVFAHNHPGGDCSPSEMDKTITRALTLAARAVNIHVFEHLIITSQSSYSFRENGLL
jgi:DNA repair protein RadC